MLRSLLLLSACCLLFPSPARAQTAETPAPIHTTVNVTATRSPLEIDNSPVSSSTVSRDEIDSRNIRQIDQALTLVEGVNAIRAKGPADNDFGLGLRGFAGRGGQNRTLILVDGQPVNNSYIGNVNWSTFSVSEMERVEVARGPFSSLYGGNAMGGVVNLITRPVDRRRLELFGQYGNRQTANYSISAADRFFSKLGLSFGYSRFQTGGYAPQEVLRSAATAVGGTPVTGVLFWPTTTGGGNYQVGLRGRNWFNQEAYRTRAEYAFSNKVFASFQYMRQRRLDGYDAYSTFLRDSAGNPVDTGTLVFDDNGVTRRLSLTPANFIGTPTGAVLNTLQAQLLANLSHVWNLRVAAGSNRSPGDWYITPGAAATLSGGSGSFVNQVQQSIYGNIQLSRQHGPQSLIFGTETRIDRARLASQNVPNYAFRTDGAAYDSQAIGKSINQAGYVQFQRSFFEKLNVVAGGRWDYWKTYDGANQTGINQPLALYPDRSANAFTGKIAASYALPADFRLRASVGNAFRNPTVFDLYRDLVLSGIYYLANPKINPEHLLAYEAGVQRIFRQHFSFDATYFENRVSDLIYRSTDFDADPAGRIRRLANAGLARTRGAEISVRQRPLRWLELRQSYTYADAVITRNDAVPASVGKTQPNVPKHTLAYQASAARGKWTAVWTGRYVGATYSTDTNTDIVKGVPGSYDPFFEMDGTFSYQLHRHLQIVLTAENLLDRRYYIYYINPGRSVFAGLRIRSKPPMRSILLAFFGIAAAFAAERPNVVLVLHNSAVLPGALKALEARYGKSACDCLITTEDSLTAARLGQAKVLFLEHPRREFLDRMQAPALEAVKRGLRVTSDVPEIVQRAWGIEMSAPLFRRLSAYWQNGGDENMLSFLLILYKEAGAPKDLTVPPPVIVAQQGVYHPDAPQLYSNLTDYLAWYRRAKPKMGALATVNFYNTFLRNRDLAFIDAQIRALEQQGLAAAGVMGWPHGALAKVFATPADDPVAVMLAFTFSLSRPEDRALLEKQNVHVINLMATEMSYEQWKASDRGVSASRINSSVVTPESAGLTDPILVATTETGAAGGLTRTVPIPERIDMAARRARRWISLREKPNAGKKLAMLYYNNPPGKGNIGASYLNLAPSIRAVLERLRQEGYSIGNAPLPEPTDILDMLERVGRNVETWAPGELRKMVERGGVTLLSVQRYREWFDHLPEQFRKSVNDRWGPPEKAELMTMRAPDGRVYFVIPGIRLGNVFLGPQLLRASSKEYTNVQHSATLPPHHGYVAAYLYYRHQLGVDAVIHMGRHGTLEWLPGKSVGQAGWDASEVILGDLPNAYYYIMDGDGEAIQARRRSAAVDISHLTPMLAPAGNQARFGALADAVAKWTESRDDSPLLAAQYAETALTEAARLDLIKQLKLDGQAAAVALPKIDVFLETAEDAPIPLGLPTLGLMPSQERQVQGLQAFLESAFLDPDRKLVRAQSAAWSAAIYANRKPEIPSDWSKELREKAARMVDDGFTWLHNVQISPERELAMLPRILRGEFEPSGLAGDPLRSPASLPAGRNIHQGDPATWPTPAAWQLGKKLAAQLLDRHVKDHGRFPERISMVLWQGETGRHEGAMEAQALYLMGVEPQWNSRGVVDRLKLIPDRVLGRPRVNVVFTVSGLYRDGLQEKIILLDRAARMAASAGDNPLSRMNRDVEKALTASGMPAAEAREFAGARVFTTAPGAYGFGLERFVEQSRDKDEPDTMAQLYLTKMNYVYTEKTWGANVPKLLNHHLQGNQSIVHSRSSNLYGAVDNDDVYQWMGGLRVASASVGAKPELFINNMRKAGQEKLEDARSFIATELNARNWNPRWIQEMKKEGYSGAREMMKANEYLYGWQATAPETISPTVWQKMYDVYVADEYKLGMRQFFDKSNPAAHQQMVARLLEVDRQGTYRFSPQDRQRLVREYVRLVSQIGVACSANICGNRNLQTAMLTAVRELPKDRQTQAEVAEFQKQFREALRPQPTVQLTQAAPQFHRRAPTKMLTVKLVSIRELAARTRRYVEENARPLAAACGLSLILGALIAFYRRRRPGLPPTALDLDHDERMAA